MLTQVNKVNHRKEFFRVSIKELREEVERLGLDARWTMVADARDCREALAIERAIKDDPAKQIQWVQRQLELEVGGWDPAEEAEAPA